MARLKVLVVDSFAGRGATRPTSQSLGRQAEVMLHALLADLGALAEVEVTTIAADSAPVAGDPSAEVPANASAHATYDPASCHAQVHVARDSASQATESAKDPGPGNASTLITGHTIEYAEAHIPGHASSHAEGHVKGNPTGHYPGNFAGHSTANFGGHSTGRPTGYPTEQVTEHAAAYLANEAVGLSLERAALQPPASRFGAQFDACMQAADAVWPLAFESASALAHLSRDILRARRTLLGSAPGAVKAAASKLELARVLAAGGVATVATYSPHAAVAQDGGAWVAKPDDGAGCLHTMLFSDRSAALAWIRANGAEGYVLQPFVPGRPGSLSLICCDGAARVLSCNQERVAMRDNRFHVLGSVVNGLADDDGALARLAQQVAAAIPGLWGYVGVNFILTAHGAVVLDVNPRLTAAYAGLHASIDDNPAALVLDLLREPGALPSPATGMRRPVSVDIGAP